MKMNELLEQAKDEMSCELEEMAIEEIKGRLREIQATKYILDKMEKEMEAFLDKPVDSLLLDQ